MAKFVDFDELKEHITIAEVVELLGLEMKPSGKQLRGQCPVCGGNQRGLVVTPEKGVYYCFTDQKGGDLIALAAHVQGVGMREAAEFIHNSSTVPREKAVKETKANEKLQPLPYLEHDHPAVEALGLDPAIAEANGIGYAPKGVARGNVVIPVRDSDGNLQGYLGVQELTFIPKDFQPPENVVPLKRKA